MMITHSKTSATTSGGKEVTDVISAYLFNCRYFYMHSVESNVKVGALPEGESIPVRDLE